MKVFLANMETQTQFVGTHIKVLERELRALQKERIKFRDKQKSQNFLIEQGLVTLFGKADINNADDQPYESPSGSSREDSQQLDFVPQQNMLRPSKIE